MALGSLNRSAANTDETSVGKERKYKMMGRILSSVLILLLVIISRWYMYK